MRNLIKSMIEVFNDYKRKHPRKLDIEIMRLVYQRWLERDKKFIDRRKKEKLKKKLTNKK